MLPEEAVAWEEDGEAAPKVADMLLNNPTVVTPVAAVADMHKEVEWHNKLGDKQEWEADKAMEAADMEADMLQPHNNLINLNNNHSNLHLNKVTNNPCNNPCNNPSKLHNNNHINNPCNNNLSNLHHSLVINLNSNNNLINLNNNNSLSNLHLNNNHINNNLLQLLHHHHPHHHHLLHHQLQLQLLNLAINPQLL